MVPYLVRFIDSLTNVYVRYNRKRLKGRNGPADTALALAALFDVLLTVCKVMAPFTPFFTGGWAPVCGQQYRGQQYRVNSNILALLCARSLRTATPYGPH